MKNLFLLLLIFSLFSCQDDLSGPTFTRVESTNVYTDSVSIRAILAVNDSTVWFAGNKGKVGVIAGKTPKLATIRYQDSILAFRSIARTKEAIFVLSIDNPAVLYKIGVNGSEATYIEEVYSEKGTGVFYDAMQFWNDKEGIAMGDPVGNCLSIIITRDGGNTWNKVPCSNLPESAAGEAAFAASNTNIAVQGNSAWIVTGGNKARVFKTTDKGDSWTVYATPIKQGGAMTGIYSVDFYNENLGIIFGGDWDDKNANQGNKAITTDGGETWELLSEGEGPGYRSCVKFVPGSGGQGIVAVGIPGVSYSSDGGQSWLPMSNSPYYAIAFVNDSIAFASGSNRIDKLTFKQ